MDLQQTVKMAVDTHEGPSCNGGTHYYSIISYLPFEVRCNHCYKRVAVPLSICKLIAIHRDKIAGFRR